MHAEHNALLNAQDKDVSGCTMYVTLHPCNECTKLILDAGIAEVIYHEDRDKPPFKASKLMLGLTSPPIKYRFSVMAISPFLIVFSFKNRFTCYRKPMLTHF